MRIPGFTRCVALSSILLGSGPLAVDNASPKVLADITLSWVVGLATDASLTFQAIEMLTTVHIRYVDREGWDPILIYRSFTNVCKIDRHSRPSGVVQPHIPPLPDFRALGPSLII